MAAGPSEVITRRAWTSPYLAAMANAAASHVAEQDDVHNGSVFHPATVVFPAAVAVAQAIGASGRQLLTARWRATRSASASASSWAARTTRCSTPPARPARWPPPRPWATCSAGRRADAARLRLGRHAVGGAVGIPAHAADSKQLHTAHAAAAGLMAAYLGKDGFTGAAEIFEGAAGHGRRHVQRRRCPLALTEGLGRRWATAETSFKYHASCRHTHPAADALLQVMRTHDLQPGDIARVVRMCTRAPSTCSARW
jgi:2-methylcitrate dehydratase PrpD